MRRRNGTTSTEINYCCIALALFPKLDEHPGFVTILLNTLLAYLIKDFYSDCVHTISYTVIVEVWRDYVLCMALYAYMYCVMVNVACEVTMLHI